MKLIKVVDVSPQHSGQVAVKRCLTEIENLSPVVSERDILVCLMAILDAAHREVLSGDKWSLIYSAAKQKAAQNGVDEKVFLQVGMKLEAFRTVTRSGNPMSGMF